MDTNKIVDRIRKLLAMAEDSSSPNEAAIAAGRAAKLMQQHNLDHADVLLEEISEDNLTENTSDISHSKVPIWINCLIVPVARLHDCEARFARVLVNGRFRTSAEFLGVKEDVLVATYVFEYLVGEINRLAARYKKEDDPYADRSDMHDFRCGASSAIQNTLRIMKREKDEMERDHTTGKELVVVKSDLIAQKYNVSYRSGSHRARHSSARRAGREAGAGVSIRNGLTRGQSSGRIH